MRSVDSSDVENPGNNLYVTGLSARVTDRDLEKHFSTEGEALLSECERTEPFSQRITSEELHLQLFLRVTQGGADTRRLFDGMSPRKMTKESSCSAGGDRIGVLPDEVLHHVLSFLPAQEAVQTCLLARRWLHLWKSTTGLRIGEGENYPGSVKDHQEFLDRLLLLHDGAPLDTCVLRFDEYDDEGDTARVNLWFQACSSPQVCQDLIYSVERLSVTGSKFSVTLRIHIDVPSIVSLRLDHFYLRTPVLEGMPSLVDALVRILNCTEDFCFQSDSGDCGRVGCESCYGIKDNNCVLLEGLSQAKTLVLINEYRSFIFKRDLKWCPTFTKLKTLLLNEYWCVPDDFSALACILEHALVLENLILHLYSEGPKHAMKIKGNCHPMDRSAAISGHLEKVEIRCEAVDKRVLKVLKHLSTFNI
ncbi:hypothetical protein E2562_001954, partial [Oryza meyeriana var. granulata]